MIRFLSLFSGIDAASVALIPLGWQPVAFAEIEPAPCSVLAHHYPHVPNLGDVTGITDERIAALGRIDVVIGGSPCQDLSVAGKRAGLSGARSSLFHEQVRLFHAARTLCGARWLWWENVPGAFSSHKGRDFAAVVGTLAGCEFDVPRDGWGTCGAALGPNGLVEWRVLDAQFFGLAQRRKRVFAVLDTGDWAGRAPVLLEPQGLQGNPAPRREAGERPAPTISARTQGGGGLGTDFDCDGGLIASTLQAGGHSTNPLDETLVPIVLASGQAGAEIVRDGSPSLTCLHEAPIAFVQNQRDEVRTMDVAGALAAEPGAKQQTYIAFSCKDHAADAADAADELAPTLRAMGHGESHANAGGQVAIAIRTAQTGSNGWGVNTDGTAYTLDSAQQAVAFMADDYKNGTFEPCEQARPLTTSADRSRAAPIVAVAFQSSQSGVRIDDVHATLDSNNGPRRHNGAMVGMQVRRLTPLECLRLQGFPDAYFDGVLHRGKPLADGPRYKALGNSFAVPIIRWIGRRIAAAHSQTSAQQVAA